MKTEMGAINRLEALSEEASRCSTWVSVTLQSGLENPQMTALLFDNAHQHACVK